MGCGTCSLNCESLLGQVGALRGCSSVVEHLLAKERVESSNLFIRLSLLHLFGQFFRLLLRFRYVPLLLFGKGESTCTLIPCSMTATQARISVFDTAPAGAAHVVR